MNSSDLQNEMPRLTSMSAYLASSNYMNRNATLTMAHPTYQEATLDAPWDWGAQMQRYAAQQRLNHPTQPYLQKVAPNMEKKNELPKLRIVRIFLVDPDNNIQLGNRILYKSDEMETDAIDQELVHEVPMKELLATHNEYRKTVRDKSIKSKEVYLEPVRMRDLILSIVTVASF